MHVSPLVNNLDFRHKFAREFSTAHKIIGDEFVREMVLKREGYIYIYAK